MWQYPLQGQQDCWTVLNQHPYKADTPTIFTVKPVLSAAYNGLLLQGQKLC